MKFKVAYKKKVLFKNKKAVSPLIATVLLIAFAVALGAVVMNWGRGYVEDTADFAREKSDTEIKCSMDIRLEFLKIGGEEQICLDNGTDTLNFTIENSGTVEIEGYKIQVVGAGDIVEEEFNESLEIAQLNRSYIDYSIEDNGTIEIARFVPMIRVEGEDILCARNALTKRDVEFCNNI